MAGITPTGMSGLKNLRAAWRRASRVLLDVLYPPRCPGCGRLGMLFCPACLARIEPMPAPACPRCGRPGPDDKLCPDCLATPSPLDAIVSAAVFAPPLRNAIHQLKYENNRSLAEPLAALMATAWSRVPSPVDLIVPVPLHRQRLAERGYNQAALLARNLAEAVGVLVDERALVRARPTLQQVGLGREERIRNVAGAFSCRRDVVGRRVLLVDDVCTTGSTLEACAEALRQGGAAWVGGFTLARARWEPGQPAPDVVSLS
ncbi:MAG: ComF family protein [Anaerolineae bacterium]